VYRGDIARTVARSLLDAGSGFRFDLSDLQPVSFGGQNDTGMQRELRAFLRLRDVGRAAARLERAAAEAYRQERVSPAQAAVTGGR
jgi:hypothetical protein